MFDISEPYLTPTCVEYLALLKTMCGEEVYAYAWLEQVIKVALVWDHAVDGDAINPMAMDAVMTVLVTEWPCNLFLRKFADCLMPTLVASISAWRYNKSRDLHYSVYREVPCAVAFILGGNGLVNKFMPKISQLVLKMREEDDIRDGGKS